MRRVVALRRDFTVRVFTIARWAMNTSRLLRLLRARRRGGTTVMIALMAPVLVGFTALTVDVGRLYVRKQALSNGVDAAALAGGRELPSEQAADAEARRVAVA